MKSIRDPKAFFLVLIGMVSACAKESAEEAVSLELLPAKLERSGESYSPDRAPGSVLGEAETKNWTPPEPVVKIVGGLDLARFQEVTWLQKGREVDLGTFSSDDFGQNGSVTLSARALNYPLPYGGAFPVLTSFKVVTESSGTREYVNLGPGCSTQNLWNCSGSSCVQNQNCTVKLSSSTGKPSSSFVSREDWDQFQFPPYGYRTTNSFPRCESGGAGSSCSDAGLYDLPSGHYYATYVMMSDSGGSVANLKADLELTLFRRKDTAPREPAGALVNGGINLNLILVGDENIRASKDVVGKRNLDLLLLELKRLLKEESGVKIGLGDIQVYEWSDANGGARYSSADVNQIGDLFESGSKGLPTEASGNRVNVFLVNDIDGGSNYTILGLSGGILGPPGNGGQASGLAFSTFNKLAPPSPERANEAFNPNCSAIPCSRNDLDEEFLEMANTVAHELGHYLGLNHPSERPSPETSNLQHHDALTDTPQCAARSVLPPYYSSPIYRLDARACFDDPQIHGAPLSEATCKTRCGAVTGLQNYSSFHFCPEVPECQYNHIMWYTTKTRIKVGGVWQEDGNLFSPQSRAVLLRSYLVR